MKRIPTSFPIHVPALTDFQIALQNQADEIERLHRRLDLFMGEVWADQMKTALANAARTGSKSYLTLLQETVDMLTAKSLKEAQEKEGSLAMALSRKGLNARRR